MKRTIPLTKRQREILDFITFYFRSYGFAPTFQEICEEFGFTSFATVHQHLTAIERKGHIKRRYNEARSIDILARSW